jgi:hypothetical protein
MLGLYILDGKEPKEAADIYEWGRFFESVNRVVRQTKIGEVKISTVFLSIDHDFHNEGDPLLFETMIFGGEYGGYRKRYSTWEQAEAGHTKACELIAIETDK